MLNVYCDGSCAHLSKDNWMGMGIHAIEGGIIHQGAYTGPKGNHNEAEYLAILIILNDLATMKKPRYESITIHSDSQIIIRQITGEYQTRKKRLKVLHDMAMELIEDVYDKHMMYPQFVWVPRDHEQQKEADYLSNIGNPYYNDIQLRKDTNYIPETYPGPERIDTGNFRYKYRILQRRLKYGPIPSLSRPQSISQS